VRKREEEEISMAIMNKKKSKTERTNQPLN